MTQFKGRVKVGDDSFKSLQDRQFDTKHGYLSKLTLGEPIRCLGEDDSFHYVNKIIFS